MSQTTDRDIARRYSLLTQAIIALGRLRDDLRPRMEARSDRTFYIPTNSGGFVCCDCGLVHEGQMMEDSRLRVRPVRPVGYRYNGREGARQPGHFVDESKRRKAGR